MNLVLLIHMSDKVILVLFRYKDPVNIPLGKSKQRIKSLKARVSTSNN